MDIEAKNIKKILIFCFIYDKIDLEAKKDVKWGVFHGKFKR